MMGKYQELRYALSQNPTPGPWIVTHELRECDETVCDLVNGTWIVTAPGVKLAHWEYDAAHIAACDPDTIRALLAERDQLADALEAAREDAERFRWLTEDHADAETRSRCREILDRMAVMSYSAAIAAIDHARRIEGGGEA